MIDYVSFGSSHDDGQGNSFFAVNKRAHLDTSTKRETAESGARVCDPQRIRCLESARIGREGLENSEVAAAHRAALRWEYQDAPVTKGARRRVYPPYGSGI